jgi:phytoene dehydrogenase-like protein
MKNNSNNIYDAIVVGGGAAGLTTAAFLAKNQKNVLLIEKEETCGGLVNSFTHNGFTFDGGIRALENAGVLFPMLKQLGIEMDFIRNDVTVGIGDQVIALRNEDSLFDYEALLIHHFPAQAEEIHAITSEMKKIARYMDIQYGIDNPLFLDPIKDGAYFLKEVLPWMFRYAFTVKKVTALDVPARQYLQAFTAHTPLIDIIAQHFFTATPAFFALSYLSLYLDYYYPKGGTGQFTQQLMDVIEANGGTIQTATEIVQIDPQNKFLVDAKNNRYEYRFLVWAADQQSFYHKIQEEQFTNPTMQKQIREKKEILHTARGNDSIFTTYIETELPPSFFAGIASSHFFYTPTIQGDSAAGPLPSDKPRDEQEEWLNKFLTHTTYEIAIPVLRDPDLAPQGKTGLIVSVLFDYSLAKEIESQGWYSDFKQLVQDMMITVLDANIFPGLKVNISNVFSYTPLSIEKRTGNFEGAITGWSFTNAIVPAESRLIRIANAVRTPFDNIFQAGMWTYSPSGFPVALITGKLASDQVIRKLK